MKFKPEQLSLYAITDKACLRGRNIAEQVEQAILGGATCIQLREKNPDAERFINEAEEVLKICRKYNVPLIINDDYKTAVRIGADGVHVGIEDAPVAEIRRFSGDDFIIGATAKTVEQAKLAEESGADYIGVGAVFPSPTKKNAIRITPAQLREICSSVSIPAVAIGGITAENAAEIKNCGQSGIAVVSAIFAADDVKSAAEKLCQIHKG
jgi:thiamine-phosphate diphosphorylase